MTREQTYGYFPGGGFDPDREVNTPAEIAAWEALCAAWNRGERPEVKPSGRIEVITLPEHQHHKTGETVPAVTGPAILCGSSLGMGTYWIDVENPPEETAAPSLAEQASDFHTKACMARGTSAGRVYESRVFAMVPALVSLVAAERRRADAWAAFADALHKGDNEAMKIAGAAAHQAAKDVEAAEADPEPLAF